MKQEGYSQKKGSGQSSNYHEELWSRFIGNAGINIKYANNLPMSEIVDLKQSLDLLKAINSYRIFPSVSELFEAHPEFEEQAEHVHMLWEHFQAMTADELSELSMQMIMRVDTKSAA